MARTDRSPRSSGVLLLVGALGLSGLLAGALAAGPPAVIPAPPPPPLPPVTAPAPPPQMLPPPPEAGVHGAHGGAAVPVEGYAGVVGATGAAVPLEDPYPMPAELVGVDLLKQTDADKAAKSDACLSCHQGAKDPHYKNTVKIGCTDCHGGNPANCAPRPPGVRGCPAAPPNENPSVWTGSAKPVRSYTVLNHENPEFIRFINPGDSRVSHISCGTTNCHGKIVGQVRKSMMTHGAMLWGAALYNNGSVPNKVPRFGEFYSMRGVPLRAQTWPPPTDDEIKRGVIPFLDPLPRYEVSQPGNLLRIFERGGRFKSDIGLREIEEPPGRPFLTRLSLRGLGTQNRTDPVLIGLQKTRLFDPTLNFLGTNDHPGDYRSSGCTACHVIYANDRSPVNSGPWAKYGNRGLASSDPADDPDPMIPKDEPGHPIKHRFAPGNSIPTSQCMICHVHPGTTVMNSYIGWMWYDEESDGDLMYPKHDKHMTSEEYVNQQMANPDEAAARGNWSDPKFLNNLIDLNDETKHTNFADFHGHGWVFRAVFKHDRHGRLLDYNGHVIEEAEGKQLQRGVAMVKELQAFYKGDVSKQLSRKDREKREKEMRAGIPMHLADIHVEKGLHCVDCHYVQDMHGNNRLQMEVRAGVEIACIDCHGTATEYTTLHTSGPASYTSAPDGKSGRDLAALRTPSGKARFERRGNLVIQNSMVEEGLSWVVAQTRDTLDPKSEFYNPQSAIAKTVHREGKDLVWGQVPEEGGKPVEGKCAHSNSKMTCQACHSSWNPTCYGCHLPQKADYKMPQLHNEGDVTRNYTSYDWQTLRDEVFMLARDGMAAGRRVNCSRSSCAIHVSSFNSLREAIYYQQQTISGEGFSGIAFSTNVPHTVSGKGTTKMCTDCHLSEGNNNNAWMAQLLMQGTGYLNFMTRYCWVAAGEHGFYAVPVTEEAEPQAVLGSTLHEQAFPEEYEEFVHHGRILEHAEEHPGVDIGDKLVLHPFRKNEIRAVQPRGEFLYAACGEGGVRAFDIAFYNHKGFGERVFTAPVSPLGQQTYIETKFCTSLASPATTAPDPTRQHYVENQEGRVAGMYAYLYATDKFEGLILIGAAPLLYGDPLKYFLKRETTFNPDGVLNGAAAITIVGTYAYISCDKGLVVVDISDAKKLAVKKVIGCDLLKKPGAVAFQFRYMYVADEEGVKVFDVTDLADPKPVSKIAVKDVHSIYLARTYAFLAAGKQGLVILDIENPENPKVDQVFTADGCINDLHDVKLAITYTSEFAYLADGKNGLRVVQLTSPDTPGNPGFSPRMCPKLIATFPIPHGGHALQIGRALDRDRAVDEAGNQLSVFGRIGGRPFNKEEMDKMYLHDGKVWKVSDDPAWAGYKYQGPELPKEAKEAMHEASEAAKRPK